MTSVGGLVLCGGRSSRMGQPKLALPFGNETLLQRVVRLLGSVVSPVVVVAAPGQELPPLPADVVVLRDEVEGRGPLAGMAVGLEHLEDKVDAAFVTGCDVPLLQPAFVRALIEELQGFDLVLPREGEFFHPLAGVYRTRLAAEVRQLLAADRLRPYFLLQNCRSRAVEVEQLRSVDPDLNSLRNVNTPEDYAVVKRIAGI